MQSNQTSANISNMKAIFEYPRVLTKADEQPKHQVRLHQQVRETTNVALLVEVLWQKWIKNFFQKETQYGNLIPATTENK